MSLTTPMTIRTLQRKLYTKAKQEAAYRFYVPYDKVSRDDFLGHVWRLVRANRGSPGVDGIDFEAIERGEGVDLVGACLGVKNIGKPCAGKPHARFDEEGQARACSLLYPNLA